MRLLDKSVDKKTICILFILFAITSCILLLIHQPTTPMLRSSQLTKKVTEEEKCKKTVFYDDKGKIAFASDVGYAMMTLTGTEKGILEKHYNTSGESIPFKSQEYYCVLRRYDEHGNNTETIYLDQHEEPVTNTYGYAKSIRTFSDDGHILTEQYYDTQGDNVCSSVFGYLKTNEYDDGVLIRQTYLDAEKQPMITGLGYASISYMYYPPESTQAGKVEREYYYDNSGEPISLSLGQYGVHKEYDDNGLVSVFTYLDANGDPVMTTKGYTTIIREYQANNSIASEKYYDDEGDPVRLAEGQYGKKIDNGIVSYLNSDGEKLFSIKNVVYKYSWFIVIVAIMLVAFSASINRKMNCLLLIFYIGVIGYFTLLGREKGDSTTRLEIMWSYKQFFINGDTRNYIIRNIWLFIPFGAILYNIYPHQIVLFVPVIISVLIEVIQFSTGTGLCELDDVISNSLGGWIGYLMARLTIDWKYRINKRKQIQSV